MKKNEWGTQYVPKNQLFKILVCMKLTFALILILSVHLSAKVHSQNISLNIQNVSLNKVLMEIEKKANLRVIYNDDILPNNKTFSVNAINEDVKDILTELLKYTNLTYSFTTNNLLVIKLKDNLGVIQVTGKVSDDTNQTLAGVSVTIKGTNKGTVTDQNGNYQLSVDNEKAVLVFNYLGFKQKEVSVGNQKVINIVLQTDDEALSEVLVIGYGTVRKSDVTGSVSSIKSKELTALPSVSIQQAMQGRAAGVNIQATNGAPGAGYRIRIRGGTSINASSEPLFVVDGFAGGIMPPPEDVESIEILKDASATAIYGSRGSNGVILVTTKRGKAGKTKIDFSTSYSGQKEINRLNLLNGSQFTDFIKEITPAYVGGGENTDWQDLIFTQGAIYNSQLSFSGGNNDGLKYYISGNYYDQQGVIINSGFKRFSVNSNLDFQATKWLKLGLNMFAQSSQTNGVRTQESTGGANTTGVVTGAFKFGPDVPLRLPDGSFSLARIGDPHDNPFAVATELENNNKGELYQFNFFADFDVVKNLKFKATFGAFSNGNRTGNFTPTTLVDGLQVGGRGSMDQTARKSYITENFLTYTNTFAKKHTITALGGVSYQKFINEDFGVRSQSFLSNSVSFWNLGGGSTALPGNSELRESQLASYFGRLNYNFDDRFLLTVNARSDGSSNFSRNNKWAFFPSGALAWNMHNEKFMQNINAISSFKWRASYGLTGNQAIGPYQTLAGFSSVYSVIGNVPVNAVRPTSIANDDLKWETTAQQNFGIDVGLLKDRTNFTSPADYILPLRELLKEGKLSMEMLDSRVGDVLRVKFEIGLFDSPYVKDPAAADKIVHTKIDEEFASQINRESLVLLKNTNNILPLQKSKLKNVLVTGPLADVSNYQLSRYGPSNNQTISVLQGLKTYLGNDVNVAFAKGCDIVDKTWPESEIIPTPLSNEEQAYIEEAVEKANKSDVIIAVVGEDEKRVGESLSRTSLGLPGRQLNLIQALVATKKPVILILINGQPLTINWENKYASAILEAWFPGVQGPKAIAETLFGDYNPGGKLSVTFPKTTGQIELNFPFKKGSHNGQPGDGPNGYGNTAVVGALYPFGYGLSYTSFQYKNLKITPETQASQGDFKVSLEVTNTGKVKGDEVVQLYIKDIVSSVTTYESVLRGFERINLLPGETKSVEFLIKPGDLEKLDANMNWTVEPGIFQLMIGS